MFKLNTRMVFIKILTLGVLIAALVFFITSRNPQAEAQDTVLINPQPDSPLRITTATIESAPEESYINISVINVGNKPIRAFAVSRDEEGGGVRSSGVGLYHMSTLSTLLPPGQPMSVVYDADGERIMLSIDFVEFADGATWGPDVHKSAERLAGQRVGGQAALQYLLKVLETGDSEAVLKAITKNAVTTPSGHTKQWELGFRTGVDVVYGRIQKANREGGSAQIGYELTQPYDAATGRK